MYFILSVLSLFATLTGIWLLYRLQLLNKQEKETKAYEELLQVWAKSIKAPTLNEYRAQVRRAQRRIGSPLSKEAIRPLLKLIRNQRPTPLEGATHRERALQLQWEYDKKKRNQRKVQ
jgi:hypothetical protein